jgi:hypothetical protein
LGRRAWQDVLDAVAPVMDIPKHRLLDLNRDGRVDAKDFAML